MIPTWGWPMPPRDTAQDDDQPDDEPPEPRTISRLNPDHPPDWRWRTEALLDLRDDVDRPEPIRPRVLDDAEVTSLLDDPATAVQAFQKIAARHQSSLDKMRNSRQIMFRSNFGLVKVERESDGSLTAVHEVYTAFPDALDAKPDRYLVQRAPLGPVDEDRPEHLRAKVFERAPTTDPT